MKNITITGTNEITVYNDYFKPYTCITDSIIPAMYNGGWNDFHFEETVNFSFVNMPVDETRTRETINYIYMESQIHLHGKNKKISGNYYKTIDKNTGTVISEKVDFS